MFFPFTKNNIPPSLPSSPAHTLQCVKLSPSLSLIFYFGSLSCHPPAGWIYLFRLRFFGYVFRKLWFISWYNHVSGLVYNSFVYDGSFSVSDVCFLQHIHPEAYNNNNKKWEGGLFEPKHLFASFVFISGRDWQTIPPGGVKITDPPTPCTHIRDDQRPSIADTSLHTHPASIVLPATLSHSLYSNARYTGTYTIPILNVTILKGVQDRILIFLQSIQQLQQQSLCLCIIESRHTSISSFFFF